MLSASPKVAQLVCVFGFESVIRIFFQTILTIADSLETCPKICALYDLEVLLEINKQRI